MIHCNGCQEKDYTRTMNAYHSIEHYKTILDKLLKQNLAELGQAKLKLGLKFTLIFCRFGLFRLSLVELVW